MVAEAQTDVAGFYTAKTDGAVDIGGEYKGTGAGENTTLTADLFHQHGDVQVMQSWETPFMHALADALVKHLTENKAVLIENSPAKKIAVLEIGFGLGLSATKLQVNLQELVGEYGRDNIEHHIVELNDAVFENLQAFAKKEEELGRAKVVPHKGNWKDVVQELIKSGQTYSGLLYDPFPTCKEEQHYHQLMFISDQHAGPLLEKNGALVYCNLTSLGVLVSDRAGDWEKVWTETQKPYLTGAEKVTVLDTTYSITGLSDVSYTLFEVTADMKAKRDEQKCNYYGGELHNFCLVPVCVKK